jgi:enolase
MSIIINIHARQILDSRGNPTVEVDVLPKMVSWEEQPYHQVLQQENMRP